MSEKAPEFDIRLNYDELANHIYTSLVDLAYVPAEDELLDITDIVYEFIVDMLMQGGVELYVISENEGDDV